jgi:Mor family transcriptional regulator
MSNDEKAILEKLNGDFKRIAEIAGIEAALKIANEFGGCYVSIPKLDGLKRSRRNAAIRATYDKAVDKTGIVKGLASEYNLTMRQVHSILNTPPESD